jgi:hypothetical protein
MRGAIPFLLVFVLSLSTVSFSYTPTFGMRLVWFYQGQSSDEYIRTGRIDPSADTLCLDIYDTDFTDVEVRLGSVNTEEYESERFSYRIRYKIIKAPRIYRDTRGNLKWATSEYDSVCVRVLSFRRLSR